MPKHLSGLSGSESDQPDDEQGFIFEKQMAISWYGDFELTNAIRPYPGTGIVPREGYRCNIYRENGAPDLPQITAAATRNKLYDLFIELAGQVGEIIDIELNTSHREPSCSNIYLQNVDSTVLRGRLWEFQDLLLNDGYTGISLIGDQSTKLCFDDHKLLTVWGTDLNRVESIFRRYHLKNNPALAFIGEGKHIHLSHDNFEAKLKELIE